MADPLQVLTSIVATAVVPSSTMPVHLTQPESQYQGFEQPSGGAATTEATTAHERRTERRRKVEDEGIVCFFFFLLVCYRVDGCFSETK